MEERKVLQQSFRLELEDGLSLKGDVRVREDGGRKPVILFSHGFKGFKDWGFMPYAAEKLALQEFAVITFNYSCNGVDVTDFDELERFAQNTYSRELADLEAVLSAVLEERLPLAGLMDRGQVFLLGHSRGGGNSVLFAAEHPDRIHGVVTWNGIADCDLFTAEFREQVLREGVGYVDNARTKQKMPIAASFFEDLDRNRERFDIKAKAAVMGTPVLFIQGDRDSERIWTGFEQLRAAAPRHRFAVLEGANHTFGAVHPFAGTTEDLERAIERTGAFFASLRVKSEES
ncbi:alpha/beta fold hydrolase [Paenibacillus sp. N4]|uniref:alpha/beta hydrolase family protein n=1 Tax=Paenibacillus vietnamensis TaxID=2590547 RepID=UPI001CD09F89|nr:alpha/beta fold hydrolase [Paenibacillus vietnamensis]MCA0756925.1 alpha/beta fold hydrolase [Paenibacillus vietnamensis]